MSSDHQSSENVSARPAVQIDGVTKSFGNTPALEPCWMKIKRGEFLTLLGPSGCGKTTLLNLIAGFLEADNGELFLGEDLVTQVPPHKREIGIVFQNYALFPHKTVAQNVEYGLRTRGVPKEESRARVKEALSLVKLENFADRKPRQMSGGQQQRVALARALVIRPRVLLLDEPFSALDRNLRVSMQIELKEIQTKLGLTTIFVTHDQNEALSMSDRIAVMSRGRVRHVGSPQEIYEHPKDLFVATFVGDTNLFRARIESSEGRTRLDIGGRKVEISSEQKEPRDLPSAVIVAARPEQCSLTSVESPDAIPATVAVVVYQGSYVELYLECEAAVHGRIMMRDVSKSFFHIGDKVGIRLATKGLNIFGSEQEIG
ncbi:ABC transporter ATP-binding protein [Acetobacter sp. TBRC 12305]|uniref:Spermidine/putrescine import ATP-binding protein PotA n=1 Tax=Acetobacter garciniae TaxID=2817435 RepID=A0A939HLA4_9PROT|nr:ABC transporter ATP-binding protein [Acetobacter garciniae]MBO1324840.1 ABC transporter ATP-binding protein [Acetobacter garciniae]MBX0344531.1 ABC transporter ATP-binding protein [Acetobacter garciniae]